jgi:hypothetical protein
LQIAVNISGVRFRSLRDRSIVPLDLLPVFIVCDVLLFPRRLQHRSCGPISVFGNGKVSPNVVEVGECDHLWPLQTVVDLMDE